MANIEIKMTEDNVQKTLESTYEAIYNALEIIGNKASDYAAGLAPVDTGNLRDSITSEVVLSEKAVYIGSAVEYAPYVEFGHRQNNGKTVPEKHFLKPAIENHIDEYKAIIESELRM